MTIKSQILISDTDIKLTELISTLYNVTLLAFYRAIDQSKTIFNLVNGFMDEYEDESGIDTTTSTNESYNSTDDYYSPSSESIDSYTKLLLHLNNNTTDSATAKSVTNNNVTFSDSIKKFGTYAASFNGSTAYLSIPDSDDFYLSGDFTVDFWVRFSDVSSHWHEICTQYSSPTDTWGIALYTGTSGQIQFGFNDSYAHQVAVSPTFVANQWYHIAIIRYGNTFRTFVDGVQQGSDSTITASLSNTAAVLEIGRTPVGGGLQYLNGMIDELRISKGIARWTSNFTPPSSEYPLMGNILLQSNTQVAVDVPTSARIVIFEEDVDSITLNTDLKAYISRDNGTTFSQVTLTNEGYYATSKNILSGLVDVSSQPSGSNIKYKIETLNNKNLKIHGVGINWA